MAVPDPDPLATYDTTAMIPIVPSIQRRSCRCNESYCKELSKAFKACGDQRGRVVQVPVSTAKHPRHQFTLKIQSRWEYYIPSINSKEFFDFRHTPSQVALDSSGKKPQVRRVAYVALHHFHPFVVNESVKRPESDDDKIFFSFKHTLSRDKVHANVANYPAFFTEADIHNDEYIVTPSYSGACAQEDLKALQFTVKGRKRAAEELSRTYQHNITQSELKRIKENPREAAREIRELREAVVATYQQLEKTEQRAPGPGKDEAIRQKVTDEVMEKLCGPHGGWNRLTFVSSSWHEAHPKQAKYLYGFQSWQETRQIILHKFGLEPPEPSLELLEAPLTEFERCVIAKMYGQRKVDMTTIGVFYGFTASSMTRIIAKWTPRWVEAGLMEPREMGANGPRSH